MSLFLDAVKDLMNIKGLRQKELVAMTGYDKTTISRYINGVVDTGPEHTSRIIECLGSTERERAHLRVSRLKDANTGPGSGLVEIKVKDAPAHQTGHCFNSLNDKAQDAFKYLMEQSKDNAPLEEFIISLNETIKK